MSELARSSRRLAQAAAPCQSWFTRCPVPTTFGIALQMGLLEREFGDDPLVSFRALQESTDPTVLQSHYTHTQPNSLRHGGNIPALYAQASGADTKVIGLSFLRSSQAILVLPESGIRSVRDLRGRRLLVTRRKHEAIDHAYYSALRVYETALATEGLTLADVEIVEQTILSRYIDDRPRQKLRHGEPDSQPERRSGRSWRNTLFPLVRGEVDAISSGGAAAALFVAQGGLDVVFDLRNLPLAQQANNNSPLLFAVKSRFLNERPDLVARVLGRVLEAELFARDDPRGADGMLAKELSSGEAPLRPTGAACSFEELELDFAPWKISALKAQADFLWAKKALPARVDVDSWLAPEPLQRAHAGLLAA